MAVHKDKVYFDHREDVFRVNTSLEDEAMPFKHHATVGKRQRRRKIGRHTAQVITVRLRRLGEDRLKIQAADNGIGIPQENLVCIFSYGFTTKKDGHNL